MITWNQSPSQARNPMIIALPYDEASKIAKNMVEGLVFRPGLWYDHWEGRIRPQYEQGDMADYGQIRVPLCRAGGLRRT